jgi:hypothetical protein
MVPIIRFLNSMTPDSKRFQSRNGKDLKPYVKLQNVLQRNNHTVLTG